MKFLFSIMSALVASTVLSAVSAEEVPEILAPYFLKDKPVRAEVVEVVTPPEFQKFVQKLSEVAQKDPVWYEKHGKKTPMGSPIPVYDEKLGMTKDEYDHFLKLWGQREVKKISDVGLMLTESTNGEWVIQGSGMAAPLSMVHFVPKTGSFRSPNGDLKRVEDIAAPAESLFGAWKGLEWRFLGEDSLSKTKESVAIGKSEDGKYGMLVYRLQEITNSGRPIFDRSMVIRFLPVKK